MKKALFFLAVALMGLAANAQVAFEENFDGLSTPSGFGEFPEGWILYGDGQANANQSPVSYMNDSWRIIRFQGETPAPFSSSWTTTASQVDRWMVTPAISLPTTGYYLSFDASAGGNANYPESLKVMVSTTGTDKANFTETVYDKPSFSGSDVALVNLDDYAGQTIYLAFVNYGTDAVYVSVDNIKVYVMPQDGLSFYAAEAMPYAPVNGECEVAFAVTNEGTNALTSYDFDVTINGAAYGETQHVSNLNVAPLVQTVHKISVPVSTMGQTVVGITVSNPNGVADADDSDNSGTASTTGFDPSGFTHSVLVENFTTGQCQYCPAGHERLSMAAAAFEDNLVIVAHHTGYGSDNMTLTQSEEIAGYFPQNAQSYSDWVPGLFGAYADQNHSSFAPALAIERNAAYAEGAANGGVIGSVGSSATIANNLYNALNTPAQLTIEWDGLSYNASSRQVTATVKGMFLNEISDQLRLNLWVVEDGIIASQVDATSGRTIPNYEHNHVLRQLVTPTWGENAFGETHVGSTFSKSYTFTLPSNVNADNAHLVAFVAKAGSSAQVFNDRHVLNSLQSNKLTSANLDIDDVAEVAEGMSVYPNPATEMAYINSNRTIKSMTLTDISGRKVQEINGLNCNMIELNVRGLEAGIYFVSITTDKGVSTQKINVVK